MDSVLREILELARWAPSADNTQPWRFQVFSERELILWYAPAPEPGIFNLDHFSGRLAMGALLETLAVAGSVQGLGVESRLVPACLDYPFGIHVVLRPTAGLKASVLSSAIVRRSTQRRRMSSALLTTAQKSDLEASVSDRFKVLWLEGWANRFRMASLLHRVGKVRLLMPETYTVHRDTIAWGEQHSEDRIPSGAIGVDPLLERIMAWSMGSQKRVALLNKLGGHMLPRLEMDIWPALACSGHFVLYSEHPVDDDVAAQIEAGRASQRFWLTAENLGLKLQPEMVAPLFCRYARSGRRFTNDPWAHKEMLRLCERFARLTGTQVWPGTIFMGRLGHEGKAVGSRSLRRPLSALLIP